MAGSFATVEQIERANRKAGSDFFSSWAIQFYERTAFPHIYEGRYFITSERLIRQDRYSIRVALASGNVANVGDLYGYLSHSQAEETLLMALVAQHVEPRFDPLPLIPDGLPDEGKAHPRGKFWRVFIGDLPVGTWTPIDLESAARLSAELRS